MTTIVRVVDQTIVLAVGAANSIGLVAAATAAGVAAVGEAGDTEIAQIESAGEAELALLNAARTSATSALALIPGSEQFAAAADGISNGVVGYASLVAGSGGANGTFDIAFTGGAGAGAAGRFVVAGGALTSIVITAPGTGYTSAPTMAFTASSGLTGASATAVIGKRNNAGEYFIVKVTDGFAVYQVDSGGTTSTLVGTYPDLTTLQAVYRNDRTLFYRKADGVQHKVLWAAGPLATPGILLLENGDVIAPDLELGASSIAQVQALVEAGIDADRALRFPENGLAGIALADYRPVDLVFVAGDSHIRFGGHGKFAAWTKALVARYGMYASAFYLAANGGTLSGTGVVYSGANAALEALAFPSNGPAALPGSATFSYAYIPDGTTSAGASTDIASYVPAQTGVDLTASWRGDYYLGTFVSGTGAGTMTLAARQGASPFGTLGTLAFSSKTGAYGRTTQSVTVAADAARTQPIEFKYRLNLANAVGPILAYGARAVNLTATKGVSVSWLDTRGGMSFYDLANQAKNVWSDAEMKTYLQFLVAPQIEKGWEPVLVAFLASAHNDTGETLQPSLGWRASTTADSAAAYVDNIEVLIKRWTDMWAACGFDERGLTFVIETGQRFPGTGARNAEMDAYGVMAQATFGNRARITVIELQNLTTAAESASYPNDGTHYTTAAGYEFLVGKQTPLIPGF